MPGVYVRVTPITDTIPKAFSVDENTNELRPTAKDASASSRRQSVAAAAEPKSAKLRQVPSVSSPSMASGPSRGTPVGVDARHPCPITADGCFAQSSKDDDVVSVITAGVAPEVAARKNVVLFFDGPSGTGKTCLAEQVLLSVAQAVRPAVLAADEAQREAAALSAEAPGMDGGRRRLDGAFGSKSTEASSTAKPHLNRSSMGTNRGSVGKPGTQDTTSVTRGSSRRAASRGRPMSASPAGTPSKFSLICALPRGTSAGSEEVELRTLSPSRLDAGKHRLIPDLADPANVSPMRSRPGSAIAGRREGATATPALLQSQRAAALEKDALQKGIDRPALRNARSPQRYQRPESPGSPPISLRAGRNGRGEQPQQLPTFSGSDMLEVPRMPFVDKLLASPAGVRFSAWVRVVPEDAEAVQRAAEPEADSGDADSDLRVAQPQTLLELFDPIDARYRLLLQLNCSPMNGFEEGGMRITVRDCGGKAIETHFERAFRAEAGWFHLSVDVCPVKGSIDVLVNGLSRTGRVLTNDKASNFDPDRPKFGRMGARLVQHRGDNVLRDYLRGNVLYFTVSDPGADGEPRVMYVLDAASITPTGDATCAQAFAPAAKFDSPPLRVASAVPALPLEEHAFVASAPTFEGLSSYIACGQVGDALLRMPTSTISFAFRTTSNEAPMCAMGVIDTPGKHVGFGIEFNTGLGMTYQKHYVCMWFRDYAGKTSRCAFDASAAYDGTWHSLSIRVLDIDAARFKVKLDGKTLTDELHATGRAKRDMFLCSSTSIAVGAKSDRGKAVDHFVGGLRDIKIRASTADGDVELVAHWPLDEGPGAVVAVDASGHGFHGVYMCRGKRGGVGWLPIDTGLGWRQEEDHQDGSAGVHFVRYDNNVVQLAAVAVRPVALPGGGLVHEEVVNLLRGAQTGSAIAGGGAVTVQTAPPPMSTFELEPIPCSSANSRLNKSDRRTLHALPQDAFQQVSAETFLPSLKAAISKGAEYDRAHLMFVLRLGDSSFTLVDTVGIETSRNARYVPRQLGWVDTVSTLGIRAKQSNALSRGTSEAQRFVARCGLHPNVFKRSQFFFPGEVFEQQTVAGSLVASSLLAGSAQASLHYCATLSPTCGRDALASITAVVEALNDNDATHAAIMLQRQVRGWLARRRHAALRNAAVEQDSREKHRDSMRRMYPQQCTHRGAKKVAIVVDCLSGIKGLSSSALAAPRPGDDALQLEHAYATAGYTVDTMSGGAMSRDALLQAVADVPASQDSQLVVHVLSYRHDGPAYHDEPASTALTWLAGEEAVERRRLEEVAARASSALYRDMLADFGAVLKLLKVRVTAEAEKEVRRRAKAKGKKKKKSGPVPTVAELVASQLPPTPPASVPFDMRCGDNAQLSAAAVELDVATSVLRSSESSFYGDSDDDKRGVAGLLLLGDSGCGKPSRSTCMSIEELARAVVGTRAERGRHAMLFYDTVALSDGSFAAGMLASSGEALHLRESAGKEGAHRRRLPLSYHVRQSLRGCAVEAVRRGKAAPPQETSPETLMRYLLAKCRRGRTLRGASTDATWFGDYVGDVWLSDRLLSTKEDRRKEKNAPTQRKAPAVCALEVGLRPGGGELSPPDELVREWALFASDALHTKLDSGRVAFDGVVCFHLNELQHAAGRSVTVSSTTTALRERFATLFDVPTDAVWMSGPHAAVHVDTLRRFPLPDPSAAPSQQQQQQPHQGATGGGGGGAHDVALRYVNGLNQRRAHFRETAMPLIEATARDGAALRPFSLNRITFLASTTLQLTETQVRRLDRASRAGILDWLNPALVGSATQPEATDPPPASPDAPTHPPLVALVGARYLVESELQAAVAEDRLFATYDLAQQAELKLRIARQQEEKQRHAEARAAQEARRPAAVDACEHFLREYGSGTRVPDRSAIQELFVVPLADVVISAVDACARAAQGLQAAASFSTSDLASWVGDVAPAIVALHTEEAQLGLVLSGTPPPPLIESLKLAVSVAKFATTLLQARAAAAASANAEDSAQRALLTAGVSLLTIAAPQVASLLLTPPGDKAQRARRDLFRALGAALTLAGNDRMAYATALPFEAAGWQATLVDAAQRPQAAVDSAIVDGACVVAVPTTEACWARLEAAFGGDQTQLDAFLGSRVADRCSRALAAAVSEDTTLTDTRLGHLTRLLRVRCGTDNGAPELLVRVAQQLSRRGDGEPLPLGCICDAAAAAASLLAPAGADLGDRRTPTVLALGRAVKSAVNRAADEGHTEDVAAEFDAWDTAGLGQEHDRLEAAEAEAAAATPPADAMAAAS